MCVAGEVEFTFLHFLGGFSTMGSAIVHDDLRKREREYEKKQGRQSREETQCSN